MMALTPAQSMLVIGVVAAITICCRALPFVLFRDNRPAPGYIIYLGRILPYAIISILVIYCLRGVQFTTAPFGAPELIATLMVVAVHLWKRNNLLSIGLSTAAYMVMVQFIFH